MGFLIAHKSLIFATGDGTMQHYRYACACVGVSIVDSLMSKIA